MSRKQFSARSKVVQKMSRDGLVERDVTAGEEKRVSMRNVEYALRDKPAEQGYSQVGNTPAPDKRNKRIVQRAHEPQQAWQPENPRREDNTESAGEARQDAVLSQHAQEAENAAAQGAEPEQAVTTSPDHPAAPPQSSPLTQPGVRRKPPREYKSESGFKQRESDTFRQDEPSALRHEAPTPDAPPTPRGRASADASTPRRGAVNAGRRFSRQEFNPVTEGSPPRDTAVFHQDKPSGLRQDSPQTDTARQQNDIPSADDKPRQNIKDTARRFRQSEAEPSTTDFPTNPPARSDTAPVPKAPAAERSSALRFSRDEAAPFPARKRRTAGAKKQADCAADSQGIDAKDGGAAVRAPHSEERLPKLSQEPRPAAERASALQFKQEDTAPTPVVNRRTARAEKQLERSAGKLEKARENLPTRRKLRVETAIDEQTGKAGRKLIFEKEVKSQRAHIKGPLPLRPVKAGANAAVAFGHRKIYQVQNENVGTEAAHKVELLAESGVRSAFRLRKTAPYRNAAKLEQKTMKKSAKLSFEKARAASPVVQKKAAVRALRRKKLREGYAKAARTAGTLAKRAGSAAVNAIKSAAAVITKHPAVMVAVVVAVLIVFVSMSLVGLFANAGTSALSGAVTASYLAENADIENAELTYTVWETELREQLENIETDYPDYDEYELDFDLSEIGHDPLALLAYLTAMYQDYTLSEIESELRALFDAQYGLEIETTVETRYNDPDDSDDDGDYEPYDWHILTVTLTVTDLAELIDGSITDDQREHYEALMETGGGRQYAGSPFAFDWRPYITCLYGWRPDPFTGESEYHNGIDIGVPVGTPIIAAHKGVVTQAVWGTTGYGRYITIADDNGVSTRYAHCDTLLAAVGQEVEQGAVIATSGSTGRSTGPHLHYEVMLDGVQVNPIFFASTNISAEEESA